MKEGRRRIPLLKRLAIEVLGEDLAKRVWSRVEFIGDIAVIKVPFSLSPKDLRPLAEALLREVPRVKSVWAAFPGVGGEYRVRSYIHLAGDMRSETIYKEYGCLFKIDITKVFLTPRLSYEHMRVAKLVKEGEVVTNMFAGVGTFSIVIAKYSKPRAVHSIDINPAAYQYMVDNVLLNKVEGIVLPYLGDAARVIDEKLVSTSDRVLMPLPDLALPYLPHAVKALRDRGIVHLYLHVKPSINEDPRIVAEKAFYSKCIEYGLDCKVIYSRVVRMVGPRKYQVVLDTYCSNVN